MSESLSIRSSDGLRLEAILDVPEEARGGLVLCHPHPQMGGTMSAPLLVALVDHFVARDWAVLRFNVRGIGGSEGTPATGLDEVSDASGALAEMRTRYDVPVAIAGWSFGAVVAIRAATTHDDLVACVGIAPSVEEKPGITAGLPPGDEVSLRCPLLVVCGTNDDLVDAQACGAWTSAAGGRFVEMAGANHFFWAKYDDLATTIGDFLEDARG